MKNINDQFTKEELKILKVGKGNERLNKYCIKIFLPPVILSVILILTYMTTKITPYMAVGLPLLLLSCLASVIWFISLASRASRCGYTVDRYHEILKRYNAAAGKDSK